jgi:hypothetical protein
MNTLKWMVAPMCALLFVPGIALFAQGPLTPPGPPAPTMKSLAQIEPRTPISSIPITISQPGSYFLTGNLTLPAANSGANGITITTDNVTIDLSGFTLDGAGIGNKGITTASIKPNGVQIRNGNVQNWLQVGVNVAGCTSTRLENLRVQKNQNGIYVAYGEVSHCNAFKNTNTGILAEYSNLTDCGAEANPVGIFLQSSTLRSSFVGDSSNLGIQALESTVEGCTLDGNYWGIVAGGSNIHHNTIYDSYSDGIRPDNGGGCSITDNNIVNSGISVLASGIWIQTEDNRVTNNHITGTNGDGIGVAEGYNILDGNSCIGNSGFGMNIIGANNTIVRNSTLGNTGGTYAVAPGNNGAPTQSVTTATNPWSNLQW